MIWSIILIALGEIFIGPTVYAYAAAVAPRKYPGLTMGLVTIGYAMANFFSGWMSQWLVVVEENSSIDTYSWGFGVIGVSVLVLSLALFFINHRLNGSYYDSSQVCQ
jgi:dipeptide/tripeptide permease